VGFLRHSLSGKPPVLVVCNFTPVERPDYLLGVPKGGLWREILNSDALDYGGSGRGNLGKVSAHRQFRHGQNYSLSLTLPPLSIVILTPQADVEDTPETEV
jgi:1,4-alpha-glucan branching enzyme